MRRAERGATPSLPLGQMIIPHLLPDGRWMELISELDWNYIRYPHALLIGGTGSGKTTLLKRILAGAIGQENAEVFLATYKPRYEDFSYLKNGTHFGDYARCREVFDSFFLRFQKRLEGRDRARFPVFLFFDEWVGFILSLNKKEQEDVLNRMGQILMLGRSLKVQVVLAMQRPDAVFFRNGARDNFNLTVAMGNLSRDGINMVFPSEYISQMAPCTEIGFGHVLIGGSCFYRIRVPLFPCDPVIAQYYLHGAGSD